ncbi:MAG: metal-dependent hydrolase [Rhodobacteraceae bacterium]|nr:MAG: metal-dependent hydrolase [Paracoccaceae bacterium]
MPTLRIATWNVRKCIGLDRRRDPHRVARVISGLGADVVALQEADKRLGSRPAALKSDLIASETDLVVADAGGHEASIGWHGNAILIRPQLEVLDRHLLHLPGIEPRGALIFDLAGKKRRLRVVGVHLGLLRSSRRAQLATIRSHLEGLDPMPTVVLGDFNEWSQSSGLEPLVGFDVHAPGRSFHAARPVAALDRIALSEAAELRDAGVVQTRDTRIASDHLPVWADVRVDKNGD